MSYVTNADIEERLGSDPYVQLTDDDGDGVADVGVVDEARLGAEGEIDSYLARRFQVPIDLTTHADLSGVLASFTLDLPDITAIPGYQGWTFWVKTRAVSGNILTIDALSPNFIDGSQTRLLTVDYETVQVIHGGTRWWTLGSSTG